MRANGSSLYAWARATWVHEFLPHRTVNPSFIAAPGFDFVIDCALAPTYLAASISAPRLLWIGTSRCRPMREPICTGLRALRASSEPRSPGDEPSCRSFVVLSGADRLPSTVKPGPELLGYRGVLVAEGFLNRTIDEIADSCLQGKIPGSLATHLAPRLFPDGPL